jgi:hypothetical protein
MDDRSQHSVRAFLSLALLLTTFAAYALGGPSPTTAAQSPLLSQVIVENGVRIKMRDGVSLLPMYTGGKEKALEQ